MEHKTHLLLCDNDISLNTVVSDFLRIKGYNVVTVNDGEATITKVQNAYFDLCLMDLNLPDRDGLDTLAQIRLIRPHLPIIVLSDSTRSEVVLAAYEKGCDDFVTKPLSIELLVYKIEAILRRVRIGQQECETSFKIGSLAFDAARQTLQNKHLSSRESDLLLLLCQNKNQVVDRHLILRTLWQTDDYFSSRSLSVYINHLRKYLEGTGAIIQGVHGIGYKLAY